MFQPLLLTVAASTPREARSWSAGAGTPGLLGCSWSVPREGERGREGGREGNGPGLMEQKENPVVTAAKGCCEGLFIFIPPAGAWLCSI